MRGKAQAPAPGPGHTDCASKSRETGVWSLRRATQRGGEGTRRGARGPTRPISAWVTPCCPASRLLPLSPGVAKELNHLRWRETSRIRMGAQNPRERVIYQVEVIGAPLT